MISEKEFVTSFAAFWSHCLPFLTPQVIAQLNVNGAKTAKTMKRLRTISARKANNDLVAELAFALFTQAERIAKSVTFTSSQSEVLEIVWQTALERIRSLRRGSKQRVINRSELIDEAIVLAKRLEDYVKTRPGNKLIVQPPFMGCGVLDSCFGDIISGTELVEIKMGERNLRNIDIRQLLVYCALNYQSKQYVIDRVTIFNPRTCIEFSIELELLAARAAGLTSGELLDEIVVFLDEVEMPAQGS